MEIKTWTVKNRKGKVIIENIINIHEWLKVNSDTLTVAILPAIKEVIIY